MATVMFCSGGTLSPLIYYPLDPIGRSDHIYDRITMDWVQQGVHSGFRREFTGFEDLDPVITVGMSHTKIALREDHGALLVSLFSFKSRPEYDFPDGAPIADAMIFPDGSSCAALWPGLFERYKDLLPKPRYEGHTHQPSGNDPLLMQFREPSGRWTVHTAWWPDFITALAYHWLKTKGVQGYPLHKMPPPRRR